jgi:prepilin-type N-terminal cleavage/methylation domain-containing protein
MKRLTRSSASSAFTLVELLVVMGIIAVLAGLAFPAIGGAIKAAKRTQASTMISNLKVAVTAYNTEYGTWPVPSGTTADYQLSTTALWADFCTMLNGNRNLTSSATVTPTTFSSNTRSLVFMEFNKKDLDNGFTYVADPTIGKTVTDRSYRMFLDGGYANYVTVILGTDVADTTKSVTVNSGVALFSRNEANGKNKALTTW